MPTLFAATTAAAVVTALWVWCGLRSARRYVANDYAKHMRETPDLDYNDYRRDGEFLCYGIIFGPLNLGWLSARPHVQRYLEPAQKTRDDQQRRRSEHLEEVRQLMAAAARTDGTEADQLQARADALRTKLMEWK